MRHEQLLSKGGQTLAVKRPAIKSTLISTSIALVLAIIGWTQLSAQSSTTDWEKAAGGKISFDVASVKQNKSGLPPVGDKPRANFPFGADDAYTPDRGYLSVKNFGSM